MGFNQKLIRLLLLILCVTTFVFAEEVVTGFEEQDLPVLNEELRKLMKDVQTNADDIPASWGQLTDVTEDLSVNIGSSEQGDVYYYNGSNLVNLSHGTSGQFLKTQGDGANPTWATITELTSSSVGQSELKTTTGEVSVSSGPGVSPQQWGSSDSYKTLPGGEYGFSIRGKITDNGGSSAGGWMQGYMPIGVTSDKTGDFEDFGAASSSYVNNARLVVCQYGTEYTATTYVQQRYVTASGHDHWIFLLVDKETGKPISSYQAPDHPSANQGDATELDIPHPFGSYDPAKHEIVIIDNEQLPAMRAKLKERRQNGERGVSLLQVINENFEIDKTSNPKWEAREIVKIDEFGDLPGETIKTMKTPKWAKLMIGSDKIKLKRKMVKEKPKGMKFKKMELKGAK